MAQGKKLAVVTGASTGIGFEIAKCAGRDGYDLVIAADELEIENAGVTLRAFSEDVQVVQADLATLESVDKLLEAVGDRTVDVLVANAGVGLGHGFLDQEFSRIMHVVNTNIVGTIYLIHRVGRAMRERGGGGSSSQDRSRASCRGHSRPSTTAPRPS